MIEYITGVDRNNPDLAKHHLYVYDDEGELWPMCDYGWNRSDGERFSILRGWTSRLGECKICRKRADSNLKPIKHAFEHKTRWV